MVHNRSKTKLGLIIGALGIVYGDIGTSPLYALKEAFFGIYHLDRSLENVLGVLSLVFWSLMIVVTVKYIVLIMRASNKGEGGIFALLALIKQGKIKKSTQAIIGIAILIGAALLFGDGIITPAISVLSAVEGLEVFTPQFASAVIPITVGILIVLFLVQRHGSGKVGSLFGPIMVLWFVSLAIMGLPQIINHPIVLTAINPWHAVQFFMNNGKFSFFVLGAVVLCITGGEALYADMGHFNRKAISQAWFWLVYPALIINYFGQGARLLNPAEIPNNNLFYSLAPSWGLAPIIVLATVATIIASQALISGAFSLANQAIALGVFPRLKVVHTNETIEGQIYVPFINWVLLAGCALLVILFKNSSGLAAAYGIAVTGTMIVTTMAFYVLARYQWDWPKWRLSILCLMLISVDLAFFAANIIKIEHGGYVPIIIASFIFFVMYIWEWGRKWVASSYNELPGLTVAGLKELKNRNPEHLLHRSVVVLSALPITSLKDKIPPTLDSFCQKWGVAVPKHLIFFSVIYSNRPRVKYHQRYKILTLQKSHTSGTILSVQVFYGYMQTPNVRAILEELKAKRLIKIPTDPKKWLILIANERYVSRPRTLINKIKFAVFRGLTKFSKSITVYLGLGKDPQVTVEMINV